MNEDGLTFLNKNITICDIAAGDTIASIARRCGAGIDQPCGGVGTCGKCRVRIDGDLPEPTEKERDIFSKAELAEGLRLACQARALPGMKITTLNEEAAGAKILESADTVARGRVVGPAAKLGVAVDIGTTTVVAYLLDLADGAVITTVSAMNPQTAFGADVISRIYYSSSGGADGLAAMHRAIIKQLDVMIEEVLAKAQARRSQIVSVVVAGNTTMEHIFAGVSPESIGRAPFEPQFYTAPELSAHDVGLCLESGVAVRLLPNIAGFVGGDITAGILYSKMARSKELSLLVDIGTNNEMVLGCGDFLICCSAAAGPALEGAKISQGMRAASGAIDTVKITDGEISVTTINNAPPTGICGSGLVDAVSELLANGVITPGGRFNRAEKITCPSLAERMKGEKASEYFFTLAPEGEYGNAKAVGLTQQDIREVQLAKGAISTGIEIMLAEAGKTLDDVDKVYVAGAFGSYLNFDNAKKIGILPNAGAEKIISLGNSAGLGACMMFGGEGLWTEAELLAKTARHIELASHKDFQDKFVQNLSF